MTTTVTRVRGGALTPFGWLGLAWPPAVGPDIRTEEYIEENRYVIRAELPGIDPVRDARVTWLDGTLRLEVTRPEEQREHGRSEFHYGSFFRSVPLPPGVREDTIVATYEQGILEITMELGEPKDAVHVVPVRTMATMVA